MDYSTLRYERKDIPYIRTAVPVYNIPADPSRMDGIRNRNRHQRKMDRSIHFLDDLNPEQAKRVYFSESPREMYLITFIGIRTLAAVFDPNQIDGWITDATKIPLPEQDRIISRLELFLNKIEAEAKQKGLPDSVIYQQDPFKNFRK